MNEAKGGSQVAGILKISCQAYHYPNVLFLLTLSYISLFLALDFVQTGFTSSTYKKILGPLFLLLLEILRHIIHFRQDLQVVCACSVALVESNALGPQRLQPARLLCLQDSPGKNTRVGCRVLRPDIQITLKQKANSKFSVV